MATDGIKYYDRGGNSATAFPEGFCQKQDAIVWGVAIARIAESATGGVVALLVRTFDKLSVASEGSFTRRFETFQSSSHDANDKNARFKPEFPRAGTA